MLCDVRPCNGEFSGVGETCFPLHANKGRPFNIECRLCYNTLCFCHWCPSNGGEESTSCRCHWGADAASGISDLHMLLDNPPLEGISEGVDVASATGALHMVENNPTVLGVCPPAKLCGSPQEWCFCQNHKKEHPVENRVPKSFHYPNKGFPIG